MKRRNSRVTLDVDGPNGFLCRLIIDEHIEDAFGEASRISIRRASSFPGALSDQFLSDNCLESALDTAEMAPAAESELAADRLFVKQAERHGSNVVAKLHTRSILGGNY